MHERAGSPAAETSDEPPDTRHRVDRAPLFFVCHSPGEDEIYVGRFFHDLSDAVRGAFGPGAPASVGYLDADGGAPSRWPADARGALATARTFVVLCSIPLFLSSRCGWSWSIFAGRLREYRRRHAADAPNLIAVPWADGDPSADLLSLDEGQGVVVEPTPGGEDLRVLIRISSHRAAYRAYVAALARRIVDTARRHDVPPAPQDRAMEAAADAFEQHPRRRGGDDQPIHVSFAVVAGTREQMRRVRANTDFYGDRREDWAPYGPTLPQPVTNRAAAVAAARRIGSKVVSLEALADRITEARHHNEIVVLLVDAWATQLDELRAVLRDANAGDDSMAVLVPTNYDDPETDQHRGQLRVAVLAAFPGRGRRPDPTFHPEVATVDRFDADLAVAIVAARSRLIRSGAAAVARAPGRPSARPILGGP